MENVGKKLAEDRDSQFENTPNSQDPPVQALAEFGGLLNESRKDKAGRSFSQDAMMDNPYGDDFFNSKILGFDLGEVTGAHKEEKGFTDIYNPYLDMESLRAEHQSGFTKAGALAAHFVGKTAIGTVGNIIGSVYGLGLMGKEALSGKDVDATDVFDNDVTRALDEASEAVEAKNSVFVNSKDGIGFNFNTFKAVNDAFSFIASAALSEMAMQTVGNLGGGAGIATLPGRLLTYGSRAKKIIKMLEGGADIEKLARRLGTTVDELSKIKKYRDVMNASTGFARKALTTTGYEAGLEARGVKDEMLRSMTDEMEFYLDNSDMSEEEKVAYRAKKTKEIQEAAEVGSLATFGLNTALLSVSNAMQFPTIFGSSFTKSSNLGDLVRTGLGEIGKKQGKLAKAKRTMGLAGRILKNPATEFAEETLQGLAGNYSKNQFEIMMGDGTQTGILADRTRSIVDNITKAAEETYGTKEGLHEGLIGAIVGAIGLPGVKRGKNGKRTLAWNGGVPGSIREESQRRKDNQDAMNSVNGIKMSEVLNYNKDNAVRAALDGQREDIAATAKNKVEFESIQDNKVFRYTMDRVEKGMEADITEDIQELKEMASTDLEKYKKLFGKDEHFSEEDAMAEVDAFAEKAEVYKNAYKKVHKNYNLNLIRGDKVTKTLTDTLTFAVATEQLYNKRLDNLHQRLFELNNSEISMEEIKRFTASSAKVAKARKPLQDYITNKNAEKAVKFSKEAVNDPEYQKSVADLEASRRVELSETITKEEMESVGSDGTFKPKKYAHSKKQAEKEGTEYRTLTQEQIDLEASEIEGGIDNVKKIVLLEDRGFNDDGERVGTVRIITDSASTEMEVRFNNDKFSEEQLTERDKRILDELETKAIDELSQEDQAYFNSPESPSITARKRYQINKRYDAKLDELSKDLASKFKPFDASKSSVARKKKADLEQTVKEMNDAIEAYSSNAMKQISRPGEKLTKKELEEYINQKKKIYDAINKQFQSKSIYELSDMDHESAEELMEEMDEITDRLVTATNVAGYLYGFKKNPSELYNKVVAAKFWENLDNAAMFDHFLTMLMDAGDTSEDFKKSFVEFENMIDVMTAELPGLDKHYDKEEIEKIKEAYNKLKARVEVYNKYLKIEKKLTEQTAEAVENEEAKIKSDERKQAKGSEVGSYKGELTLPDNAIDKSKGKDEEPVSTQDPEDPTASSNKKGKGGRLKGVSRDMDNNRFLMREASAFTKKKPEFVRLLQHIDELGNETEKGFKDKAAVTLSLQDTKLDPAQNPGLEQALKDKGVSQVDYLTGLQKVKDNPELLNEEITEMDEQVFRFLQVAPIQMNIYDKVLSPSNDYKHELEDTDEPIYTQYLFAAKDMRKEKIDADKNAAEYSRELVESDKRMEAELAENKTNKTNYKNAIEKKYAVERNQLYHKYKASGKSEHTNLNFRALLLRNHFIKGNNTLKLKIQSVDQGNFEKADYLDPNSQVEEYSVDTLGFNADTMEIDDIFYGNQKRTYVRVDRADTSELAAHPFKDMATSVNGRMYFKYTNKTGKQVPIQMNTLHIDLDHRKMIGDVLKAYFDSENKTGFVTKNTGVDFLDGLKLDKFLSFFMNKRKDGKSLHKMFLKNVYYVDEPSAKNGYNSRVTFYTGGVEAHTISSKEEYNAVAEDILTALGENRFIINADFLVDTVKEKGKIVKKLNRKVLKYMFDKKIINHNFNVSKNYDKIYAPGYNKGLVISMANTPDTQTTARRKKENYAEGLKKLKDTLVGNHRKRKKYEVNMATINSNLLNRTLNIARIYADKFSEENKDAKMTEEVEKDILDRALTAATNASINAIMKFIENGNAHRYNPEGNHEIDPKITREDTDLDILLRAVYHLKNKAYRDTTFRKKLAGEMQTWGSKQDMYRAFRNTEIGKRFALNTFTGDNLTEVESQIKTEKQFMAMKRMANVLKELTEVDGYVHIDYTEDYAYNYTKSKGKAYKRKAKRWSYLPQGKLDKVNKTKGHYKTRLKSVKIVGEPEFVDGKIVGGSILFNVGSLIEKKNDKGEVIYDGDTPVRVESNDQIVFMADSTQPPRDQNVIISMHLPYVDNNFNFSPELAEADANIQTRKRLRKENSQNVVNAKTMKALGKTSVKLGLTSDPDHTKLTDKDYETMEIDPVTKARLAAQYDGQEDAEVADYSEDAEEIEDPYAAAAEEATPQDVVNNMLNSTPATQASIKEDEASKKAYEVTPEVIDQSYDYSNERVRNMLLTLTTRRYDEWSASGKTIDETVRVGSVKAYARYGITSPEQLVAIVHGQYHFPEGDGAEPLRVFRTFAETVFDRKIKDCNVDAPF